MKIAGQINEVDNISARVNGVDNISAELDAVPGETEASVYLLVDEAGNEIPAVLLEEKTVFTATSDDIRFGKTAVTEEGVTVGTKNIPLYQTEEGYVRIAPGKQMSIEMFSDMCQYTKLQAIICAFNKSSADSVSAEMVVINDNLYHVRSVDEIATVTVDNENQSINLGITNDSGNYLVIRYFTYREEY